MCVRVRDLFYALCERRTNVVPRLNIGDARWVRIRLVLRLNVVKAGRLVFLQLTTRAGQSLLPDAGDAYCPVHPRNTPGSSSHGLSRVRPAGYLVRERESETALLQGGSPLAANQVQLRATAETRRNSVQVCLVIARVERLRPQAHD